MAFSRPRSAWWLSLIPSFLTASTSPAANNERTGTSIPSLDGLKGLACIAVVNEHITYNFSFMFTEYFGKDGHYYPFQLPFIRLLFAGDACVCIFFVISGYVLSYRCLQKIHVREYDTARQQLSSATFRRGIRLYLPAWTAIIMTALITRTGLFRGPHQLWMQDNPYRFREEPPALRESFMAQMREVFRIGFRMLDVFYFRGQGLHGELYDHHLWTIPHEFRCSMVLFAALSALMRVRLRFRLPIMLSLGLVMSRHAQRPGLLFMLGAMIADLDCHVSTFLRQEYKHDTPWKQKLARWLHPASLLYPILLVLGLYLCCVPIMGPDFDPFYKRLLPFVPLTSHFSADWWLRVYGACFTVWATANGTRVKSIFTHPFSLYMGRICFGLYVVHGTIIRLVLHHAIPMLYAITGDGTFKGQTPTQTAMSWALGTLLAFPPSIWCADIFWRAVDLPSNQLARWIENAISVEENGRGVK